MAGQRAALTAHALRHEAAALAGMLRRMGRKRRNIWLRPPCVRAAVRGCNQRASLHARSPLLRLRRSARRPLAAPAAAEVPDRACARLAAALAAPAASTCMHNAHQLGCRPTCLLSRRKCARRDLACIAGAQQGPTTRSAGQPCLSPHLRMAGRPLMLGTPCLIGPGTAACLRCCWIRPSPRWLPARDCILAGCRGRSLAHWRSCYPCDAGNISCRNHSNQAMLKV